MLPTNIRPLLSSDIPFAMSLVSQAGWNQLPGDWERLLQAAPQGCFLATVDDQPVATVTTTSFGKELAWIGMMLVDPAFRRQGLATQLLQYCIRYLHDQGIACIKLDATPAGRLVYERIGFVDEWSFQRWERPAAELGSSQQSGDRVNSPGSERATSRIALSDFEQLDRDAFGADRRQLLELFARDSLTAFREDGYGMLREGRLANYLGPIVAKQPASGQAIAAELAGSSCDSRMFWDIPGKNTHATELAQRLGFQPVRELIRMRLGPALQLPHPEYVFALSDPATG